MSSVMSNSAKFRPDRHVPPSQLKEPKEADGNHLPPQPNPHPRTSSTQPNSPWDSTGFCSVLVISLGVSLKHPKWGLKL
ncbi:unnamed protein product [Prunus armeniaca]